MTAVTPRATGPLRVAITTLGCKVNYAEMAELAGTLAASGCDVVPEHERADVRVLNSCTVTLQADATTRQRIARLQRHDPGAHLVLTGCSVDANPATYGAGASGDDAPVLVDAVFANEEKHRVAEHVLGLAPGARREAAGAPPGRSRAFLKVQDGCDHRCTYCIVWRARGASRSVPDDAVLRHAAAALEAGHRELVVCGVDLGSYGRDTGSSLASLLHRLLDLAGSTGRVRLSSINANDVTPALIELSAHPRLCPHWHMPLQSGSDAVLRAMHRGYRRAQYLRVAAALRAQNAQTELTTDVMVGFPGETEDDHLDTLQLIDDAAFLGTHVFRWSPRPGTPAATMDARIDGRTARRRSAEVRRASARTAAARLHSATGRVHEVVWDAVDPDVAHGLTAGYHEITVPTDAGVRMGALSAVRADSVAGSTLRGTLLAT